MKIRRNSKGLTLIEVILAMAIASIIMGVIFNLFFSNRKIYGKVSAEFDMQSQVRYASEVINNSIKYSTVSFAVLDDHYTGKYEDLTDEWNYLGLSEEKDELIHYKWDEVKEEHIEEVLISKKEGFSYELYFEQNKEDKNQKTINYNLTVSHNAGDSKRTITEIKTGVESINAIQIIDRGKDSNKEAIALAYRTDPTPKAESQKAAVAMVLDNSGSMAWDMRGNENITWKVVEGNLRVNNKLQKVGDEAKNRSGGWLEPGKWYYSSGNALNGPYNEKPSYPNVGQVDDFMMRITILKNQAKLLVEQLSTNKIEGDLFLVPFSTRGEPKLNSPNKYEFDIIKDNDKIKTKLGEMDATGGTNTGDGLRRAYYLLEDLNKTSSRRNYLIVLVDGVTTYYSTKDGKTDTKNLFLDSGVVKIENVKGKGSSLDSDGEEYVKKIGEKIRSHPNKITTFVIGFSNKWDRNNKSESYRYLELESVNTIATACGIESEHLFNIYNKGNPVKADPERVFWANDEDSLQNVFDSISRYIEADFWQISGPDNK